MGACQKGQGRLADANGPPVSRADVASQKSDHTNQQWEVEVAGAFLEDAGDDYGPLVRDRRLTWPERGLLTYYKGSRRLADAHGPPWPLAEAASQKSDSTNQQL